MILDTTALSDWAKSDPGLTALIRRSRNLLLPVIVIGEYLAGIIQVRDRQRRELLGAWLAEAAAQTRITPVTFATAEHYAAIVADTNARGRAIPANDAWIAASAVEHGLPVLSRDRHFDAITGVRRIGW